MRTPMLTANFDGREANLVDTLEDAVTLATFDTLAAMRDPSMSRSNRTSFIRRNDDYERWLEAEVSGL